MNTFTCTGAYTILILYGIKRTENRNVLPEPRDPPSPRLRRTSGRAAISCSKSFCKEEYGRHIAWASVNLPPEDFEKLPAWREVKDWLGKVVGVCDYKALTCGTRAPAIARSRKSLESVDSAFIEISKGRTDIGRGLSGYDSQKRKTSQPQKSSKNAFCPTKSGVIEYF